MEVRYKSHHAGNTPEERLRGRERNSGGEYADHIMKPSQGARFHNVHVRGQGQGPRHIRIEDKKS